MLNIVYMLGSLQQQRKGMRVALLMNMRHAALLPFPAGVRYSTENLTS